MNNSENGVILISSYVDAYSTRVLTSVLCMAVDALSELSAQTDVFAKTHSIPVTKSKSLHDPLSSPPIHSSSYSSIVSNTGKAGDHQLPPTVVSMAPRHSGPEGLLATGGGNSENLVINSCQPSGLITMSGEFNVPLKSVFLLMSTACCACVCMTDDCGLTLKLP